VGLLLNAIAYTILVRLLIHSHGRDSEFATRIGSDLKGQASLALYIAAVGLAFVSTTVSLVLFFTVAAIWFIPDRRFER
jgi:uncharacterized membrane protein